MCASANFGPYPSIHEDFIGNCAIGPLQWEQPSGEAILYRVNRLSPQPSWQEIQAMRVKTRIVLPVVIVVSTAFTAASAATKHRRVAVAPDL